MPCRCGPAGRWGTAVDGGALARLLGEPAPADPVGSARQVFARLAGDRAAARSAVGAAGATLGPGIAGLVNPLDPDVVTVGGLGAVVLAAAPAEAGHACRADPMRFRRSTPPPVPPARLVEDGPHTSAAERVWAAGGACSAVDLTPRGRACQLGRQTPGEGCRRR